MTTQTCSCCGSLSSSTKPGIGGLGIRHWACSDCGTSHDRDVNAAKNILRVGLERQPLGEEISVRSRRGDVNVKTLISLKDYLGMYFDKCSSGKYSILSHLWVIFAQDICAIFIVSSIHIFLSLSIRKDA